MLVEEARLGEEGCWATEVCEEAMEVSHVIRTYMWLTIVLNFIIIGEHTPTFEAIDN